MPPPVLFPAQGLSSALTSLRTRFALNHIETSNYYNNYKEQMKAVYYRRLMGKTMGEDGIAIDYQ